MYGKLFKQMYEGSLVDAGWQALVTLQQLVILADKEGVVDMTAEALSRRTTIPLEIITAGLAVLEQPDSDSRTPHEEGRRIMRLSDTRAWGWRIVNYEHYRLIRNEEERRDYQAKWVRDRRAERKNQLVDDVDTASTPVDNVDLSSMAVGRGKSIPTTAALTRGRYRALVAKAWAAYEQSGSQEDLERWKTAKATPYVGK
jgi:hypothetical protein